MLPQQAAFIQLSCCCFFVVIVVVIVVVVVVVIFNVVTRAFGIILCFTVFVLVVKVQSYVDGF